VTPTIPPTTRIPTPTFQTSPPANPDQLLKTQSQEIYNQSRVRKYIALALFLPPLGLFIAWREKLLHLVVPSLLLAESILFGLSSLFSFLLLKPTLSYLKADTSGLSLLNPIYGSLVIVTGVLFALGIITSIHYKHKVHYEGHLQPKATAVMLLIYLAHFSIGFGLFIYFNNLIAPSIESNYQNLQQTQEFLSQ
jgi:hypothetical protein